MYKTKQKRIEKLRSKKDCKILEIQKYREYQQQIRENSEKLYRAYLRDEYNRDEYRRALNSYLQGRSAEEWLNYYEQKIIEKRRETEELEKRIKNTEESRANATLITALLLIVFGLGVFLLRPMITGFTAYNITENMTAENVTGVITEIQNVTLEQNITKNITEMQNITAGEKITENITTEKNITQVITQPEVTENITLVPENITEIENITAPQPEENITINITENITQTSITETNITENVSVEKTNRAPKLLKEIQNMTMMAGESRAVNLAEYFADEDNDTIIYLASATEGISISITADTAEITAEAPGEYAINFIASDLKNITYSNEVVVNVTEERNRKPVCSVPNLVIIRDSELTLNLSDYCSDADNDTIAYALLKSENLTIVQSAENITIKRQQDFAGTSTIGFEANDGTESVESAIIIEVLERGIRITAEEYLQSEAEIGKPVKWQQKVKVENTENKPQQIEIAIPEGAENITIYKRVGRAHVEITEAKIKMDGKEVGTYEYNRKKAEERNKKSVKEQRITGMAVAEREGKRLGLLERFIDWLIGTWRKIGEITGFAVSNANITEAENLTSVAENISVQKESETQQEQLPEENITQSEETAAENITALTTENITEIENITSNITETNATVAITANITEPVAEPTIEENITVPQEEENITQAEENITESTENITTPITENITQSITQPAENITEIIAEAQNITAEENITQDITAKNITENITTNITPTITNITEELRTKELLRNITLVIQSQETEEYIIEYFTEIPESIEGNATLTETYWTKNVTISSRAAIHYKNIIAYSEIIESKPEQIHLYWLVNDTRTEVTRDERFAVRFEDSNNNSLIDKMYWRVPMLSNESFEIEVEITILTVQSYPMVGGNWTTEFNTTGTANLTITAYNGTTYAEEATDLNETADDLRFLLLKCGDEILNDRMLVITNANCINGTIENSSIECFGNETTYANYTQLSEANISIPVISMFIENYTCNSTAYYTVYVMTYGRHTQEFRFDGKTAYAYNIAGLPVITLLKPVNNTIIHNGTVLNFSITGEDAAWYNINYSTNNTFYEPYEINTSSWTEGIRDVTVYANNSEGNVRTNIYTFDINNSAYGHFEPYYVWPYEDFGNTTVARLKFFTFKAGVRCVGGPCGDINATLDPEQMQRMTEEIIKKQIELYINEQMKNQSNTTDTKKFSITVKGIIVQDSENENGNENEKIINVSTEIR